MEENTTAQLGESNSQKERPGYVVAQPWERYIGYLLEIFPVVIISFLPVVGPLLAVAYLLARDAIFPGQSFGKKILKLKVIDQVSGKPASMRESVIRNFPLAMNFFFPLVPIIGHLIGGVTGTIVFVIEAIAIATDKEHRRLGDKLAGTIVIKENA